MSADTTQATSVKPAVIQETLKAHVHEQVWEALKAHKTPRASAQIATYTKLPHSIVSNSIVYLRSRFLVDITKQNRVSSAYKSGQRLVAHFYIPDVYKDVPWTELPHTPSNSAFRPSTNRAALNIPQNAPARVAEPVPTPAPAPAPGLWNEWIEQQSLRDLRELHLNLARLFA